jgi:hypothetical protein
MGKKTATAKPTKSKEHKDKEVEEEEDQSRTAKLGLCGKPHVITKMLRKTKKRHGRKPAAVLTKCADVLFMCFLNEIKKQANEHEKIGAKHVARVVKDTQFPLHGVYPQHVAGIFVNTN